MMMVIGRVSPTTYFITYDHDQSGHSRRASENGMRAVIGIAESQPHGGSPSVRWERNVVSGWAVTFQLPAGYSNSKALAMKLRMTKAGRIQTVMELVGWPVIWLVYLYVPDPAGGWDMIMRPLVYASPLIFAWNVVQRFRTGGTGIGEDDGDR